MGSESTTIVFGSASTTIVHGSASTKSASGSESTGYRLPGCRNSGLVVRCLRRALVVDVKGKEGEFSHGCTPLTLGRKQRAEPPAASPNKREKKTQTRAIERRKLQPTTTVRGPGTGCW